ncbi:MAG TPA: SDR family NAD(P)-dependent oxidoreductase [Vicinamibacterales bacterium]|nr:SDR family NAD(P)-dependent oxidoreductase [Vicinamibacterales bacterium]
MLITGASRGLGLVMARRLAQQGAMLGLLARNAAELTRARQTIDAATLVQLLPADVTDPAQVQLGQWANGPMGQWADGPIGQSANRQAP